ncbi:unnamed protein product [Adineta ricciae]|uniref:Pericentrin/AKAP-450 centrosomal targeting domain-containing protein n=1 Tax=Adineta ricciae TaxID=249248 RepID=A0A815P287_ADIRI|nr:unnamed protein product [Adineta ricciae]
MASTQQQQVPQIQSTPINMTNSPEIDWKKRCEQLQIEYQLELKRIHHHYDRELREKVNEVRLRLKHEYDQQIAELRARLSERHDLPNMSLNLDQSFGDQIREQVRLAEEHDRYEDEQHQQLLSQQSNDNEPFKRLINKLHSEGVQVLSLTELLDLQIQGTNINSTNSMQKLHEENACLRSLIANVNANGSSQTLIECLADIFRCEQERRLSEIQEQEKSKDLEEEIHQMCEYQRQALGKLLSQNRLSIINELEQTKKEFNYLKENFEQIKQNQNQSIHINSHRLNKFYLKYLRCEAYRRALIYQKHYLLVLLTGYEDTETYALNEIRRLTGDSKNDVFKYDKMGFIPKQPFPQRAMNYRFRFRCYVTVVIGIIRMRWLVKKWTRKIAAIR